MRGLICFVLIAGIVQAETKNTSAATPAISPPPGIYGGTLYVTLTDSTPDAVIHFTIDGTAPNESSPVYTEHILIPSTTKIRAMATAPGYSSSKEFAGNYDIESLAKLLGGG